MLAGVLSIYCCWVYVMQIAKCYLYNMFSNEMIPCIYVLSDFNQAPCFSLSIYIHCVKLPKAFIILLRLSDGYNVGFSTSLS